MITVKIGTEARDYESADAQWIGQHIRGLERDGLAVCVRVKIEEGSINMTLSTRACGGGGGAWQRGSPTRRNRGLSISGSNTTWINLRLTSEPLFPF